MGARRANVPVAMCPVCVPAPPGVFLPVAMYRYCTRVPCVPCVSRLPPVSFYRYCTVRVFRVSRECPGSPRCLFTGTVPRAYRGFRPHRRPLRVCRTRLHFADRLRAGAGRRSGSGRRQGRVCWGRPLLSRPRGAVGFGLAAVESAAASVVALTSDVRGVCCWWVWLVVRFVCVPLCVRVFRVSRVCPGSPRCLFTGTVPGLVLYTILGVLYQ